MEKASVIAEAMEVAAAALRERIAELHSTFLAADRMHGPVGALCVPPDVAVETTLMGASGRSRCIDSHCLRSDPPLGSTDPPSPWCVSTYAQPRRVRSGIAQ